MLATAIKVFSLVSNVVGDGQGGGSGGGGADVLNIAMELVAPLLFGGGGPPVRK